MIETFDQDGIRFQYPANWTLELDEREDGWTATLQTPDTAVLMITFDPDGEPAEMADEVLEAFQEDYDELDSEVAVESIGGHTALGHDIDLLTLDTPVLAIVRALNVEVGCLLMIMQFSEADRARYEGLMRAVLTSLTIKYLSE